MGRIKPSRRCPNPQKTMNVFKRELRLLINLNKSIIWIILVRPVKSQGIGEEGGRIVSVRMMHGEKGSTGCALKMDKESQDKECWQPLEFGKSI